MRFLVTLLSVVTISSPAVAQDSREANAVTMRRNGDQIQFDNYPPESLARGQEGDVGIVVVTDREGRIQTCSVRTTSGYHALDRASCDLVTLYGRTKPFAASGTGRPKTQEQIGTVVWRLPPGHPRPATRPPFDVDQRTMLAAGPDQSRRICKTQTRTGSLVDRQRICMSASEWEQQRKRTQDDLNSMQPRMMNTN